MGDGFGFQNPQGRLGVKVVRPAPCRRGGAPCRYSAGAVGAALWRDTRCFVQTVGLDAGCGEGALGPSGAPGGPGSRPSVAPWCRRKRAGRPLPEHLRGMPSVNRHSAPRGRPCPTDRLIPAGQLGGKGGAIEKRLRPRVLHDLPDLRFQVRIERGVPEPKAHGSEVENQPPGGCRLGLRPRPRWEPETAKALGDLLTSSFSAA